MSVVAVVGSRTFTNYELVKETLGKLEIKKIVSGGAQGADKLGEQYAKENKIETLILLPEWKKYGRAAGFIRNEDIVKNCDKVVAFWDGISKGTLNSIQIAKKLNKEVIIVKF
jgi:predicted Rossmann fold nucleotide-binding protein DprA/Smf involved in DNA uptake